MLKGKAYLLTLNLEKFIPDIDTKILYLSVNASKSGRSNVYLMVVNKNLDFSDDRNDKGFCFGQCQMPGS